jgi:HK97 family phage major capsid protein
MSTTVTRLHDRVTDDPACGFGSPRDFLSAVMDERQAEHVDSVGDHRLRPLATRGIGELAFMLPLAFTPASIRGAAGSDEQGEYADPFGGFLVPSPAVTPFALAAVEGDPTAGRTLALPMSVPRLTVLARVDKNHSTSVSGGLAVGRTPETVARTASRMEFEAINLEVTSLFGFTFGTEELVVDSRPAFVAILAAAYADEFGAAMLNEKIRGVGGSEYLGVLNSPAKVVVAAEGGQSVATIVAENIMAMTLRSWRYDRCIWICNPNTRSQLTQAVLVVEGATGGGIIKLFRPATREGEPDMLDGRPCYFSEFASTLGDEGDIILCDWSQYLEGTLQPLGGVESMHVRFIEHERAFKFWTRNAGAPWWRSALTPANGTATLSPIVTLATRA